MQKIERKIELYDWWPLTGKANPSAQTVAKAVGVDPISVKKYLTRTGTEIRRVSREDAEKLLKLPQPDKARRFLEAQISGKSAPEPRIEKGPENPQTEESQSPSPGKDSPPNVPDLSDLESIRVFFLSLQQLIRDQFLIGWDWDKFEQATVRETIDALVHQGFPKWAQAWWQLIRAYEISRGWEVEKNLNITRGLWMRESLRRDLYGQRT